MSHRIFIFSIAATDVALEWAPGQSVLDALLKAGIALPHSCRKGVCGSRVSTIAAADVTGVNGAFIANETCLALDGSVLKLRLPLGQRAKFQAEQYLQVVMDDGSTSGYSMANPPQESDSVTPHIRHVPGDDTHLNSSIMPKHLGC